MKYPYHSADDKGRMAGQLKVDRINPYASLRTRPLPKLNMLDGFGCAGGNVWEWGSIYDTDYGKFYTKCKVTLIDS